MPYRATWRLIGVDHKVLSRGELDGVHASRGEAAAEILLQLQNFDVHGRDGKADEWWARRTVEADLEMRFRIETRTATEA
jgi:hypothetical protein